MSALSTLITIQASANVQILEKNYITHKIYLPDDLNEKSAVVIMLHGCTQNAQDFAKITDIKKWSNLHNFIAIFPEQSKLKNPLDCWNWFSKRSNNKKGEIKKIIDLADGVIKKYNLEDSKFFVVGFSAGAAMSNIIGNCYPERVKAMASHDGAHFKALSLKHPLKMLKEGSSIGPKKAAFLGYECSDSKNDPTQKDLLPSIVIHSDQSKVIPTYYANKMFEQLYYFNDLLDNAMLDDSLNLKTEDFTTSNKNENSYKVTKLIDNDGKILMEKNIIYNSHHSWSGGAEGYRFSNPKGPSSSQMIFDFFKQHGL